MSYEDALLRATQKPPYPDSSWKAIRFSSGMRPADVRQGTARVFTRHPHDYEEPASGLEPLTCS
jgi:hypothetical protein